MQVAASARINKRATIQTHSRQLIDRRCSSSSCHRRLILMPSSTYPYAIVGSSSRHCSHIDSSSRHDLRIDTSSHGHSTETNLFLPTVRGRPSAQSMRVLNKEKNRSKEGSRMGARRIYELPPGAGPDRARALGR